jgi:nucleoside recognition membrane protein YjiH
MSPTNENQPTFQKEQFTAAEYLKFIVPSVIAFTIFLGPVKINGSFTTIMAWMLDFIKTILGKPNRVPFTFVFCAAGGILTIVTMLFPGKFKLLDTRVKTKPMWAVIRIIGAVLIGMTAFNVGPQFLIGPDTGATMGSVCVSVILAIVLGGLILPFLTNFGALQFVGSFMERFMTKVFRVPGMACIDCLVSWIGSSSLAVYYTAKVHSSGLYTDREAATIITNFSLTSLPFLFVMAGMVGLDSMAYQTILTSYVICIILAIILPRIYPLNRYKDTNINGEKIVRDESIYRDHVYDRAISGAIKRARQSTLLGAVKEGVRDAIFMPITVVPIVMAIGTVALAIYEYTPILHILAYPFGWLCQLVGIPEAYDAGVCVTVNFVDQLLAPVVGSTLHSEVARFFSVVIGTCGVLYISQPIPLILGSSVPVTFKDIVIIYLERILLTIILIVPFLRFFFG